MGSNYSEFQYEKQEMHPKARLKFKKCIIILAAIFISVIQNKYAHELHGTVRQGAHLI
jgi:hypothetical protein